MYICCLAHSWTTASKTYGSQHQHKYQQLPRMAGTHLQSCRLCSKGRVLRYNLGQNLGAVGSTQCFIEGRLERYVLSAVVVYLVDHLDGVRQTDRVHPDALDLGHDRLDALVLQALR